jgi:hypothetical protein
MRKSIRTKSARRKSIRRNTSKYDGVRNMDVLPHEMLVNIHGYLRTCEDEYNLLASNAVEINNFTITANTCPKVKFLYIIIKLNIGGFLRNMIENERKTFITKLKVYMCLHPEYYPTRFNYGEINALLTNIILITAETPVQTTANPIYVLNCHYNQVPVYFQGVILYIKTTQIGNRPEWLTAVVFYGFDETLPNHFLSGDPHLTTVSYKGMTSLRTVGNGWMFRCANLTSVNLEGLINLRIVGNNWMSSCYRLLKITLLGLISLQSVGDNWMRECSGLITINFEVLNNLLTVRNNWMFECTALRTINLKGLINLQSVGRESMYDLASLSSAYMNPDQPVLFPNIHPGLIGYEDNYAEDLL